MEAEQVRARQNPHYPPNVKTATNAVTVAAIKQFGCRHVAEIGILDGDTSVAIARLLDGKGTLHLFDFDHNIDLVAARLKAECSPLAAANVVMHGNSTKLLDSYNWSLAKLLVKPDRPPFDYVFIDGAHTWNVDALTFFLVDRLLAVGGYVDFDDYNWSLARSPTLAPGIFAKTAEFYTAEQIEDRQVKRVVDTLVKPHPRYVSVKENKIYRKLADDGATGSQILPEGEATGDGENTRDLGPEYDALRSEHDVLRRNWTSRSALLRQLASMFLARLKAGSRF
jgi:predicted O-methyltransferase YrrM